MPRRQLLLLVILLAAFALRLYRLHERVLWYDEAFSVFLAEQDLAAIVRGTAADIQPPLYYLLLHFWRALGDQLFVMRFPSVVLSLLCVPLVYALARKLVSSRAAIFAMLFVAIAPFQIHYAQELRMYALLVCALLVYLYAFVSLLHKESPVRACALLALSGAAALYSQSLAALTWIAPDIYLLLRRDTRAFQRLLIGQSVSVLLFAPWLVVLSGQIASVQRAYWTTRPGLAETIQMLLAFTTNLPLPAWYLPIALFVTLALVAILTLQLARAFRRGAAPDLILAFVVVPPLLMFVLSYLLRSIFVVRALILSALAFAMLVGWLVARARNVVTQSAFAVCGVALLVVPLAFQSGYDDFPRSPYPLAVAYLRANARADDAIVHDNKLSFFPMRYYDRALPQTWLADPPAAGSDTLAPETMQALQIFPSAPEDATRGKARVWLVIFQRAIDEARAEGRSHPNLIWFDEKFRRVSSRQFNDLNIFLYQR